MLPFSRIYLDSNAFIGAGWPTTSTSLQNVLTLAAYAKVKVFMLDAVQRELRAHWVRNFEKTCLEAQRKAAKLQRLCSGVGATATLSVPRRDEILKHYDNTVDKLLDNLGLEPAVATMRPVEELYEMAIWHRFPFKEKGSGFQDAVICLAVIDHLRQSGSKTAAFISRDDVLGQEDVSAIAGPQGVDLLVYREPGDCEAVLKEELVGQIKASWAEDRKNARVAMEANKALLTQFLRQNLQIPERLGIFRGTIVGVNDIEAVSVVKVDTPLDKDVSQPVRFSAELAVRVQALVESPTLLPAEAKTFRVGVKPRPRGPFTGTSHTFGSGLSSREESLDYTVDVELEATLKDGRYTELKPLSAKLVDTTFFGTSIPYV
jgi:PIN domain